MNQTILQRLVNITQTETRIHIPASLCELERVITELDGCLHPSDNFYLELRLDSIHTFCISYIPGRADSVYGISVQLAYLLLYIISEQNFSDNISLYQVYTNNMWSYEQKKDVCRFAAYLLMPEETFSAYCKKMR